MRWVGCAAALSLGILLAACRFIPTDQVSAIGAAGGANGAAARDPDQMAASMWTRKSSPISRKRRDRSSPCATLPRQRRTRPAKYGYRAKAEATPWTLMVRIEGTIVTANTELRAATIGVDASGQGKTDATVQIGPAMRGTLIRDALDFVSFGDFTNQIDFARFGKAFNIYVNRTTLEALPRDSLIGRKATVLGAYQLGPAGETPLVTPVEIAIGPKP